MHLMRMIYCSEISEGFKPEDIEQILEAARKNNARDHVSGMLCFNHCFFLQCLEGDRISVNKVYRKILNDNRHSNILLLAYSEIEYREFNQWSMAYLPQKNLTEAINFKYSGTPEFDPYSMSGSSVFSMLKELKKDIVNI